MRKTYMCLVALAGMLVILGCWGAFADTMEDASKEIGSVKYGMCMYAGNELVKIEPLIDDNGISHNVFCRCGELDRGDVDSSKCDMFYLCSMSEDGAQCARGFEDYPQGGICKDLNVNGAVDLYCVVEK